MKTISAADANRNFSQLLRDVKAGATVVVTSHGRPVARVLPVNEDEDRTAERERAWKEHLRRLRSQPPLNLGRITRDEIYDGV